MLHIWIGIKRKAVTWQLEENKALRQEGYLFLSFNIKLSKNTVNYWLKTIAECLLSVNTQYK